MLPNPFEYLGNLLDGDQAPGLNDLNFRMGSFSIDLPEIKTNSTLNVSVEKVPEIKATVNAGITQLPEIKTSSDLNTNINVGKLPEISVSAVLKSLPKIVLDAGLDNLRIRELAPVNLQFSLKPARLRLPFGYTFKVGVLGLDIFSFSMQGEVKAVLEDL